MIHNKAAGNHSMHGVLLSRAFFALLLAPAMALFMLQSCSKNDPAPDSGNGWSATPYTLDIPQGFPDMPVPGDNPMTVEGVQLGRMLFYDPILSADNTQSCASCHSPEFAFTDNNRQFSTGIDGIAGSRNSMALMNAGWFGATFWDGRTHGLEEQAFEPVTNPIEMHNTWPAAVSSLKDHPDYPELFHAAFGIHDFDSTHVVRAIAQFERTLISADAKWDRYLRGEEQLTITETRGYEIFFTEKGDCFHCHTTILFTDNIFHNNGLDSVFADPGLFRVTGNLSDVGRFKTPTLRNLNYTAPYMHDGRFATLREVVDFYSEGVKFSSTVDPLMKKVNQGGIQLSEEEKEYLIAFLLTLNDNSFINNPAYANPFENE